MRLSTLSCLAVLASSPALARDEIRIVGSSTVFPFSTAVAEQFGRISDHPTPIVEATGSGGGMKLFCAGLGENTPDIANASRRMKAKEFTQCAENGVTDIIEVIIGFDGIVIANALEGPEFELSLAQLVIALAANGPMPMRWDEIDPSLPAINIEILGPPPSSGTRDAFEELVLHKGCKLTELVQCGGLTVREDGVYVDAGENDNLIVSKLEANIDALGIFGFSFLDQNSDVIKAVLIDGVEPTFDAILSGDYTISRSLFFYLKAGHFSVIPGLEDFAAEFVSESASGQDGYLADKGLIPLDAAAFLANAAAVSDVHLMTETGLH